MKKDKTTDKSVEKELPVKKKFNKKKKTKKVIIPIDNQSDLKEIPDVITDNLEIVPVEWIDDVITHSLESQPKPQKQSATYKQKSKKSKKNPEIIN